MINLIKYSNIRKFNIVLVIFMMLIMMAPAVSHAISQTIDYKGTAVYWEYGRKLGVYSYSQVQTHKYEHSATANSKFSGWQEPGIVAYASDFVGTGLAKAYWDCR